MEDLDLEECESFLQNLSYYCGDNVDVFDTSCLESVLADINGCVKSLEKRVATMKQDIVIEKNHHAKACETNMLALNCFLNNVVQAAERNPGMEEFILQDFCRFVNDNHVILPALLSENDSASESTVSLNYIHDDEWESSQLLWERIRRTIKAGITTKLRDLPLSNCKSLGERTCVMLMSKRQQLINCLLLLYTYGDVLQIYSNIRSDNVQKLEQLTKERRASVTWADEADIKNATVVNNFTQFLGRLTEMMQEDFKILSSENFRSCLSISVVYSFMKDVYTQKIFENVDHVLSLVIVAKRQSHDLVQMSYTTPEDPILKHNDVSSSSTEFNVAGDLDEIEISQVTKVIAACMTWQRTLQQEIEKMTKVLLKASIDPQKKPFMTKADGNESYIPLANIVRDSSVDNDTITYESIIAEEACLWYDHIHSVVASLSKGLLAFIFNRSLQFINNDIQFSATGTSHAPIGIVEQLKFNDGNEYPPKITLCGARIFSMLDEFIIVAHGCGLGVFDELRNALVEVIPCCFQEFHTHLTQSIRRFPQAGSIRLLYLITNTCSYASSQLNDYIKQFGKVKLKTLSSLVPLFQSLHQDCVMIITTHHLKIIKNTVLQDVESNNWEGTTEFFEGERCSFPIEMWNFYLRSLVHDFSFDLSSVVSRCLLLNLLRESLKTLVTRYAKVRPSYKRIDQYRADISTILHVSYWLLWHVADSNTEILKPDHSSIIANCQTMCTTLLSYMVFVTSPLSLLSDYIVKLAAKERQPRALHTTDWLATVSPIISTLEKRDKNSIEEPMSLIMLIKLVSSHQIPSRMCLLQVFSLFDALLPITICSIDESKLFDVVSSSEPPLVDVSLSWHFSFDQNSLARYDNDKFSMAVCNLLFATSDLNDSLSAYLLHLFQSFNDSWSLVANWTRQQTSNGEFPIWLTFISGKVNNILYRILYSSVEKLCEKDRIRSIPSCVFSTLTTLPCGCPVNQPTQNRATTMDAFEIISESVNVVLDQLISAFSFFPKSVKTLFQLLDSKQTGAYGNKKSIGLQIVAILVNKWMSSVVNLRTIAPFELTQQTTSSLEAFSELLWHILHSQELNVASNPAIPTEICSFIKKNSQPLTDKLATLQQACAMRSSAHPSTQNANRPVPKCSDMQYDVIGKSLRATDPGYTAMIYLFKFLSVNAVVIEDHLLSSVAIRNPVLLERRQHATKSKASHCKIALTDNNVFDAVAESQQLGDYYFDQSILTTAQPDWNFLFEMFPVARKKALQSLVWNRVEFQDGAVKDLTNNEIVSVATISKQFGVGLQ